MNSLIYYLVPFVGSFFILFFVFYCMQQLGCNRSIAKLKILLIIGSYTLFCTLLSFLGNGLLNLAFLLLIPVIGHFIFQSKRIYFLFYCGLLASLYLTDAFISLALRFLTADGILYISNSEIAYLMDVIFVRFIEFAVLRIITTCIQKCMKNPVPGNISKKQFLFSLLFPAFSIFNMICMLLFLDIFPTSVHEILFFINVALFIVLNLFFVYIIDTMTRNNFLETEIVLFEKQQEIQTRYYKNLEDKYDRTKKLRHDMRNHLQALQKLYESDSMQDSLPFQSDAGVANEYLNDVQSVLEELSMHFYTNNKMLNIILNDKVKQMVSQDIFSDIAIDDIQLDFIRNIDITTIFANILDNAIASANQSPDKFISLRIIQNHDLISITLKNAMLKKPSLKNNQILSGKKNHEGLGLKNVAHVVAQYHGDIQYEWSDNYFITRIMLNH